MKKPGNPAWVKGGPSPNPSGKGRRKGPGRPTAGVVAGAVLAVDEIAELYDVSVQSAERMIRRQRCEHCGVVSAAEAEQQWVRVAIDPAAASWRPPDGWAVFGMISCGADQGGTVYAIAHLSKVTALHSHSTEDK